MFPPWYIVKCNWPNTRARFPLYAGLGGNVWPFSPVDAVTDKDAKELHSRMEKLRTIIPFGSSKRFVCTDLTIAEEYFTATKKCCEEVWLLQVTLPNAHSTRISGVDIGFPDGGFSVIEQELITQQLTGPSLNELGLIQTFAEADEYFERRKTNDKLEQLAEIQIVNIIVLSNTLRA